MVSVSAWRRYRLLRAATPRSRVPGLGRSDEYFRSARPGWRSDGLTVMRDHHAADNVSERPRFRSRQAVRTAALLGFNLVLLAWALRRLPVHLWSEPPGSSPQLGLGETIFRVSLYGFIAAVAAGHLWFMARMLRLCGILRPMSTLLLTMVVSTALILPTGVLLRSLLEPDALWVAEVFAFPLAGALAYASVAWFASHPSNDGPATPRPVSTASIASAAMLGVNVVLVAWASFMFWSLSMLGIGMSARQEPLLIEASVHALVAVAVPAQVWFLVRMMRCIGVVRPVSTLMVAIVVSIGSTFVAGMVLWSLWSRWQLVFGYASTIPLLSMLAAGSFALTVRLAHRTRILLLLAIVASVVTFVGVLALLALRW